jgi:hypothetical protein
MTFGAQRVTHHLGDIFALFDQDDVGYLTLFDRVAADRPLVSASYIFAIA